MTLHPNTEELLGFFEYSHLDEELQGVSQGFYLLAHHLVEPPENDEGLGLEGPEATAALRKLLEAKDCAVRAAIVKRARAARRSL